MFVDKGQNLQADIDNIIATQEGFADFGFAGHVVPVTTIEQHNPFFCFQRHQKGKSSSRSSAFVLGADFLLSDEVPWVTIKGVSLPFFVSFGETDTDQNSPFAPFFVQMLNQ
jgi:hypothetical protein